MSQNAQILSALKNGERLTPLDALIRFGCFRLSARINNLKVDYDIKSKIIKRNGKRCAVYWMDETA